MSSKKERPLPVAAARRNVMKQRIVSALVIASLMTALMLPAQGALSARAMEPEKEESVSIKADAAGTVYRVTSENILAVSHVRGAVRDVSFLTDIRNTDGEEEFHTGSGGALTWDNLGYDIRYEGEANPGDLPFAIRIRYYLDGKEMTPEEIAGKSGEVTMRFTYDNLTAGEEYVPFLFVTAVLLPVDVFTDVTCENASVTRMGDHMIVYGYVIPGLSEALYLSEYEGTKDIRIPEHMEITATADVFALDFTVTLVTNGLFGDLETDDLDDAQDLVDGMEEISDASAALVSGTTDLLEGAERLRGALSSYTEAGAALRDGAGALAEGLGQLGDHADTLNRGAEALRVGAAQLQQALSGINPAALSGNSQQAPDLSAAAQAIATHAATLATELQNLSSLSQGAGTNLQNTGDALAQSARVIRSGGEEIVTQSNSLERTLDGLQANIDGQIAQLSSSSTQLEQAIAELQTQISLFGSDAAHAQAKQAAQNALSAAQSAKQATETALGACNDVKSALGAASAASDTIRAQAQTILTCVPQLEQIAQGLQNAQTPSYDPTNLLQAAQGMTGVLQGMQPYMQQMTELGDIVSSLSSRLTALREGVAQLSGGASVLADGVGTYTAGVAGAAAGARELADGTSAFASAGTELLNGYDALLSGIRELADGMHTFDGEAIDALNELAGEELSRVIEALRTVKAADDAYTTFSGAGEGYRASVRFIIETDAVKP